MSNISETSTGSGYPTSDRSSSEDSVLAHHLELLNHPPYEDAMDEIRGAPVFTSEILRYASSITASEPAFTQYGLLAGVSRSEAVPGPVGQDDRIFYNSAAPSSTFICGSQGSGKSHTLSCLLENCLAESPAAQLPRPLTGIVFHYDSFSSDNSGAICEAATLSSNPDITVRVLCPPTNIRFIKRLYAKHNLPNITVEELRINESDLNTRRMMDLMVVSEPKPLYVHVVERILRGLRIAQQSSELAFNYAKFKTILALEDLTPTQQGPLKQRLDTLESFMVQEQTESYLPKKKGRRFEMPTGTCWKPKAGQLTIVDLSCPCVTPETACSLFNICLSLFLEQDTSIGRVVALDEAHKFLTGSEECETLTNSLLSTIRLQRHLAARVIISTQEPTISPVLLDLCSIIVVHRFTSPAWLKVLREHLAGVSSASRTLKKAEHLVGHASGDNGGDGENDPDGLEAGVRGLELGTRDPVVELLSRIVSLRRGEALLFAPGAVIHVDERPGAQPAEIRRLGQGFLKIRVRNRITADGGRSIMAS